ncbi:hypothetical protein M9H77_28866 [Catharanthus roseus]|uniref:Uncharacterized protein n=1 Tax=Catharanthus roseus TaxID=4058 RepID=A0ACC0AGK8_CATRO|nr:hypothetical protein M9H77_28866 [Catharanthus roseus]
MIFLVFQFLMGDFGEALKSRKKELPTNFFSDNPFFQSHLLLIALRVTRNQDISFEGDSFSNHQGGLKKDDDDDDDLNLLSGAGNNLIEEKADSGAFSSSKTVSGRRQISISTTQPMDNSRSSQFSSSNELRDESRPDQDPSTGANLANSSFSRNQFEGKATRMVRTKHGSDSLLSVIQREKTSPPSASGGFLAFSAGSIPFSGSISQRSNSTTSTRSFAFPIIAAEWYESPVRMAEADRPPRSKKPKCWAMCFKCYRI